jgi:2-polyprenyl-6-methoxyphenol hydroxylase-like FAD-dependent oxidoreductase
MKILIVGGGVSGLSLAGLLRKYGIGTVTLVEQAPDFRNAGYVIGLWGNGRRVLRELGIDRRIIEQEGYEISWTAFHDRHGKLLKSFPLNTFSEFGPPAIISRSALQRGIVGTISGVEVRFGTLGDHPKAAIHDQLKTGHTEVSRQGR